MVFYPDIRNENVKFFKYKIKLIITILILTTINNLTMNVKTEVKLTGDVALPPELDLLYASLFKKINNIIITQKPINIKEDATTLRILIQSSMVIVESIKGENGKVYSGPEKKRYALILTKMVLKDLANEGKLDKVSAQDTIDNMDFYGGLMIDLAIDGVSKLFDCVQNTIQNNNQVPNNENNKKSGCNCFGK